MGDLLLDGQEEDLCKGVVVLRFAFRVSRFALPIPRLEADQFRNTWRVTKAPPKAGHTKISQRAQRRKRSVPSFEIAVHTIRDRDAHKELPSAIGFLIACRRQAHRALNSPD